MSHLAKLFPWLLGCLILLADFLSKAWTHAHLPRMSEATPFYPYGGIPIFKNFLGIEFSISHTINKGAAWGLGAEYQTPLLYLRIFLILMLFGYVLLGDKKPLFVYPMVLILAGALGNVMDYFIYGHVVDMFHFVLWGYDFPVFNIADSSIFLGIVWLILLSYL